MQKITAKRRQDTNDIRKQSNTEIFFIDVS